jgi:hypothetical protein
MARIYSGRFRNQGPACRSTEVASSSRRPPRPRRRSQRLLPPSRLALCQCPAESPAPGTVQHRRRTGRGPQSGCQRRARRARRDSQHARRGHGVGAVGGRQGPREPGACALEVSLRVRHRRRSDAGSRLDSAERPAGSEFLRTIGDLCPHVPGSAQRTSAATRCRTLGGNAADSLRTVSTWGRRRSPCSSALTAWIDRPAIVAIPPG